MDQDVPPSSHRARLKRPWYWIAVGVAVIVLTIIFWQPIAQHVLPLSDAARRANADKVTTIEGCNDRRVDWKRCIDRLVVDGATYQTCFTQQQQQPPAVTDESTCGQLLLNTNISYTECKQAVRPRDAILCQSLRTTNTNS